MGHSSVGFPLTIIGQSLYLPTANKVRAGTLLLNIQLDEIKGKGLLLQGEVTPDAFPQLTELIVDGDLRFSEQISYRLSIQRLAGMVEVDGYVDAVVELSCGRCLDFYKLPFSANFYLAYAEQLPECVNEDDEETELAAEEMGLALIEGDEISLLEPLQEQLLMALPIQPLCQRGCKGLCSQCGCNLNITDCNCSEPLFDTRFASLQNLKVKKKN